MYISSLCVLNDPNAPESGEDCFQKLLLEDGSEKYTVLANDYDVRNRVVLPQNLTCERCVLRWHYNTGEINYFLLSFNFNKFLN